MRLAASIGSAAPRLACVAGVGLWALTVSPSNSAPAKLDGIWRSDGFAEILDISGDRVVAYDINRAGCFRRAEPIPVGERLFREPRVSPDARSLVARSPKAVTLIRYRRLGELPTPCVRPSPKDPNDPVYNFDVFWSWFDETYAFFSSRGVDWNALRDRFRPQVSARTTPAELLEIFRSMLRPLQDRHTSVEGPGIYVNPATTELFDRWMDEHRKAAGGLDGFSQYLRDQAKAYLRPSWTRYLDPRSVREVHRLVTVGAAGEGQFGYIQVLAESGYSGTSDTDKEIAAADKVFDEAFASLDGKRGLILDVRINYGGHDEVGMALAGLLTDRDRPGFGKCMREGASFSPVQAVPVRRRPRTFSGPVVILTSPDNVSAGENLIMVARSFPNVLIVGDRSASVHSDVLEKPLPNGWAVGISNEVFIAPDGSMYETVGVPPDVLVPYAADQVKATGVDPLMEKALELLQSKRFAATAAGVDRAALGRRPPCS